MTLTWGAEDGLPRAGNTGAAAPLGALAGAGVAKEGAAAWTSAQLPSQSLAEGTLKQAMANALDSSHGISRKQRRPALDRKHWVR